jgi:predicted RNA binding protein YcfA (HicA-like mRNA interferase family)
VQQRKMKVREVIRMLEQDGWYLDRTRGSHRQYKHPKKPGLVTVPANLETILGQELLTAF